MQSNYFYFIQLDQEGNILQSNSKFHKQFLSGRNSSTKNSFSDYIHSEDFSNFSSKLTNSISNGEESFVLELRRSDSNFDDFHWCLWEFTITVDDLRRIQISGIGHNTTKPNDENLEFPGFIKEYQTKNEIMEGLFNDNVLGFWVWDIAEGKNHISNSLKRMLGYEEVTEFKNGIRWHNHIHPEDKDKVNDKLKDHFVSLGNIPFHCDFRIEPMIGLEIWVIGYGKVIRWDKEGNPLSMVGCLFDISEKKKSEFLLEKQSKFLKDLTFNQSHMMRSKLANIIGLLDVMDSKCSSQETSDYLSLLNKEANKLDEVLRQSIYNSSALNHRSTDS